MTTQNEYIARAGQILQDSCHGAASESGWWTDLKTGERQTDEVINASIPTKLLLVVSEVIEGFEGFRKGLMDDKLPHRKMLEVELADAVIRCFDLAGAAKMDLGGAIAEKMAYNAQREDHKLANRRAEGGKKF